MKSPFAAKAMARGNFKRCRVLLGSNTNEGHYFIMYYLTNIFKKQVRWQDDVVTIPNLNGFTRNKQPSLDFLLSAVMPSRSQLEPERNMDTRHSLALRFASLGNESRPPLAVSGAEVELAS